MDDDEGADHADEPVDETANEADRGTPPTG
jgi:hypothetical protein